MNHPADTREDILLRLCEIFEDVTPGKVFRNRLRIDDSLLPAIAVIDGDETPEQDGYGRGRPANGPIIVTMRPEIYAFTLQPEGDNVGSALNRLRKGIVKTILNDETLLELCKDGDIRYEGFSTGLAAGRSMEGEMGIAFAFIYVLRPAKL